MKRGDPQKYIWSTTCEKTWNICVRSLRFSRTGTLRIRMSRVTSAQKLIFGFQLVELKSGETYNGHLKACDGWMNICLVDVICTSRVRASAWTWKRGSKNIKQQQQKQVFWFKPGFSGLNLVYLWFKPHLFAVNKENLFSPKVLDSCSSCRIPECRIQIGITEH